MQLDQLVEQYRLSHQNVWNQRCHAFGMPMIIASVLIFIFAGLTSSIAWWLFSVGWILQFIGHGIERTVPEFLKNPVFLLVGPIFFWRKLQSKLKKS